MHQKQNGLKTIKIRMTAIKNSPKQDKLKARYKNKGIKYTGKDFGLTGTVFLPFHIFQSPFLIQENTQVNSNFSFLNYF